MILENFEITKYGVLLIFVILAAAHTLRMNCEKMAGDFIIIFCTPGSKDPGG